MNRSDKCIISGALDQMYLEAKVKYDKWQDSNPDKKDLRTEDRLGVLQMSSDIIVGLFDINIKLETEVMDVKGEMLDLKVKMAEILKENAKLVEENFNLKKNIK